MSLFKNRILLRYICAFLVIVFLVFILFGIYRNLTEKRLEASALKISNIEFQNKAEALQRFFLQIRYAMSEISSDVSTSDDFANGTYINKNDIRSNMRSVLVDRRQNEFSGFIASAFVVDLSNPGYVYELTETIPTETFFNQRFVSNVYSSEYWISEANAVETFRILRSDVFSQSRETKRVESELLPVAYKPQDGGQYMMVILLDASAIIEKYDISAIYTNDGELICSRKGDYIPEKAEIVSEKSPAGGNVLLKFCDQQNGGINLVKTIKKAEIKAISQASDADEMVVFVVFLIFALSASALVFYKKYKSIKGLFSELDRNREVNLGFGNGVSTLEEAKEAVKLITSQNVKRTNEETPPKSVLDSIFLQSQMRDVYVAVDDIENKVNDKSALFYMIYYRVNYTENFEQYVNEDIGKATFLLKQLIEMHIESMGLSATTLQIEKNAIVSVFDAKDSRFTIKEVVDLILERLLNESEYAFFTMTVSRVFTGVEKIKSVYDSLSELSKYGKPLAETQVLFEGEAKNIDSRFCFSVEEMGRLTSILRNGSEEEVARAVNEILESNIKKEINRFEISLLCTEIINCGVKLVNRVFHSVPQGLDVSVAYRQMEKAYTLKEYRDICVKFLKKVMAYISQSKRGDDYIISYIIDYVEKHYAEDIYLNLFAEKLKLTGAYISSYFKEKMNVNLSDYVNNYRIEKAVELAKNPQNKNRDIAVMVGLPNINTFIRLFKKYTGYTPGEYRKNHFGEK